MKGGWQWTLFVLIVPAFLATVVASLLSQSGTISLLVICPSASQDEECLDRKEQEVSRNIKEELAVLEQYAARLDDFGILGVKFVRTIRFNIEGWNRSKYRQNDELPRDTWLRCNTFDGEIVLRPNEVFQIRSGVAIGKLRSEPEIIFAHFSKCQSGRPELLSPIGATIDPKFDYRVHPTSGFWWFVYLVAFLSIFGVVFPALREAILFIRYGPNYFVRLSGNRS